MPTPIRARGARWRATLTPVLNLLLFAAAIWVVNHVLAEYRYDEIAAALTAVPLWALGFALAISAAAYLALVGYDHLAFRYAGRPLPLRSMLLPSFVAWAVGNSAPASVLTGGGLRYRLYAALGLTPAEAAVVAAFNVVTYLVGLLALVGLVLLLHPSTGLPGPGWMSIPGPTLGGTLILVVAGYLVATHLRHAPIRVLRWRLTLPSFGLALAQPGISSLDWLLSSGALYACSPAWSGISSSSGRSSSRRWRPSCCRCRAASASSRQWCWFSGPAAPRHPASWPDCCCIDWSITCCRCSRRAS
jgi:uncharacterized membrane protein YbhN (UPF0104 family)